MTECVNKVIILGHIGGSPEIRQLTNGKFVARLRVATSETWTDRSSSAKYERTEWHSVSIFSPNAVRFSEAYLVTGSKVYIEGQLQTRKWRDQSGQDRYTTEVVVNPIDGRLIGLDSGISSDQSTADGVGTTNTYEWKSIDVPF